MDNQPVGNGDRRPTAIRVLGKAAQKPSITAYRRQFRLWKRFHKRKNWLFSDTVKGVNANANLYSLIETAKANGLEPYGYLRRVFTELPAAESVEAVEALLPYDTTTDQTPSG